MMRRPRTTERTWATTLALLVVLAILATGCGQRPGIHDPGRTDATADGFADEGGPPAGDEFADEVEDDGFGEGADGGFADDTDGFAEGDDGFEGDAEGGLGIGDVDADDAAAYLEVAAAQDTYRHRADDDLLRLGTSICAEVDAGVTPEGFAQVLEQSEADPDETMAIIEAATDHLCAEHRGFLEE